MRIIFIYVQCNSEIIYIRTCIFAMVAVLAMPNVTGVDAAAMLDMGVKCDGESEMCHTFTLVTGNW